MREATRALMVVCFGFGALHYLSLLMWSVLSARMLGAPRPANRELAQLRALDPDRARGVSIIMPAYNEAEVIVDTVRCALAQNYPSIEVVVVNDGSKDRTLQVLKDAYYLVPTAEPAVTAPIVTKEVFATFRSVSDSRLLVIDKAPSGAKADNSNVGVNYARYPWVVIMDADELLQPDVVSICMSETSDNLKQTVAVGATLLPSNDCVMAGDHVDHARAPSNYWVGCQLVEYAAAFFLARPGMSRLGALPIISGGFGLFNREAIIATGGYRHGHLGEDMDMCVRLHRYHRENRRQYAVRQAPEAVVWTEFPHTCQVLTRQRIRWHRGLRMVMRDHRRTVANPRYGAFGTLGMASLYLFEWIGPLIESMGYVLTGVLLAKGWIEWKAALAVFTITQVVSLVASFRAVALMARRLKVYNRTGDLMRLFFWCLCQPLGYRQITLWWRLRSLLPGEMRWGDMPRLGFTQTPREAPAS